MQINRPLIWILASYLAGILLKGRTLYVGVALAGFMSMVIIFFLHYLFRKGFKLPPYYFLVSLPFFFVFGFYLAGEQIRPPLLDGVFEEEMEVTLQGELIGIEEKGDYQRFTLKNVFIETNVDKHTYHCSKTLIYNSNITRYRLGNILKVSGTLKKFQVAANPGQFNEYEYYKNKNTDYKVNAKSIEIINNEYNIFLENIYRLKLKFQNIYNSILPMKQAGILSAMILGDSNSLDEDVNILYKKNGISHIIAISGLHVSLLGLTLYKLLRRLGIPILVSTGVSVFLLYAYGILTNFSVSTNRSIVMLILYMISLLVGRTYDLLSGTAFSALLILIQNPLELYNVGFLLSFGAIAAIGTLYPIVKQIISIDNRIVHSLLMCIAIQLVTTPVLLYFFYEIPAYSVLVNLLIIPLSSLVILLAVIAVLLGSIYLPFGLFFIGGAYFILNFFEIVCKLAIRLPYRNILTGRPDSFALVSYFFILFMFLLLNQSKIRKSSITILAFLVIIFLKPPSADLEVTFLDVGQGDGVIINLPGNTTLLVDGGSTNVKQLGKYRIETFLKYKGIKDIDYAVVTHADADHISGLQELMESGKDGHADDRLIKHLVLPYTNLKDEAYNSLITLAGEKGIPVIFIKKGDVFRFKDISITCLHPAKEFLSATRNGYSTVLSLSYKEFDLLLTGDLEADGEKLVCAELKEGLVNQTGYEVLKVAHHGSKFSSGIEFLNLVHPKLAVISCGKKNTYGHPHEEVLDRLEDLAENTKITYKTGAITIRTDGRKMRVWEYLRDKK